MIYNHIVNQIAMTKFISEIVDFFSPIPRLVHIERRDNVLGKPSCTVRSNEMKNEFPYSKWKNHYLVVILVAERAKSVHKYGSYERNSRVNKQQIVREKERNVFEIDQHPERSTLP